MLCGRAKASVVACKDIVSAVAQVSSAEASTSSGSQASPGLQFDAQTVPIIRPPSIRNDAPT